MVIRKSSPNAAVRICLRFGQPLKALRLLEALNEVAQAEQLQRFDPLPGAFRSALAQRARPHSAATPAGTLPTGIEALERSLAAARAERVETLEPVERSAEAAARELLEERQVQNQHHCPRTVTRLRSAPSFLKPPVQLGRQVVAEQRQVEFARSGC